MDEIMLLVQALPPTIALEIAIVGCWHIWMQRNSKIFTAQPASITSLKDCSGMTFCRLGYDKRKFEGTLCRWIEQHLN